MNKMKKLLSSLLALSMVLSYVPMYALAAEGDPCTVTEGCQGTYNAEGICTVCNLAQPVVTEGAEECQHSGGTATCIDLAVCEKCNETYGELAAHSYENGVCTGCGDICAHAEYAEGKCIVCGKAEPDESEECQHSGGVATCKEQAVCEKCETAYGELAAHNYGTDADGKCDACGADCSHAEYLDGKCKVCGMDEPVQEPVVLTITAWNWVDEYEIISEDGSYATLPNAADWETLKSILPAVITAMVDGVEVEIPVQWECETFPTEGEGQGTYELKAILPEGYALGESVSTLKLEVDLGVADQLADSTTWDGNTVATAYAGGTGTAADPYIIETAGQLIYLRNQVNGGQSYDGKYFCLDADLDMAGEDFGDAIGNTKNYNLRNFNGHFDGNHHKISNLTIGSANGYSALFGNVGWKNQEVVIKNLTLVNVNVNRTSTFYGAAALVGNAGYLKLENCTVESGTVQTNSYTAGGFVANAGAHDAISLTIIDCVNKANITQTNSTGNGAGGIVGQGCNQSGNGNTTITGCINYGDVSGRSYAAGIIGNAYVATIEKCANYGDISAIGTSGGTYQKTAKAAGILVSGADKITTIENCYNAGNISSNGTTPHGSSSTNAGGAAGIAAFNSSSSVQKTITNCHNVGTVTSDYGYPIGLRSTSIANAFYLNKPSKNNSAATQKSAAEFADGTVYNLLSANNPDVWGQTIGTDSYPVFFNRNNVPTIKETVEVTVTADSAVPYSYDGNAKSGYTGAPASGAYTGELEYVYAKVNADNTTTPLTQAPKDAGTYTLVVKVPESDENYKGESTPITFTIQPKEVGITWGITEFTYNGQEQAPTATATELIDGDTCTITVEGGQTDAGTGYIATATAVSNTNYKLPEDGVATTFAIKAAEITDVTLAADSAEVTGSAQIPTISTVKAGELMLAASDYTVSYKDSAGQPVTGMKNVGTYKVVVTAAENSNFSGSKEVEWKITKKQPTITTVPTVSAITYGQTLADATLAGGVASVDGTFAFKKPTTAPTVTDSNSTEYTLVFTPTDAVNYDSVETKVKVTVNPKEIGITWGTAEFTYDSEEKLPTASVAEGSAINGDQLGLTVTLVETTAGAGINAGTYTAKVTGITGDKAANYKLPTNVTTSFEIKNASQTKPENLTGKKETIRNKADGTIAGLTTAMEISKEENGTYTPVTDGNMTFDAGTYYVRYAAKANYDASPATAITIDAGDPLRITVPGEQTAYSLTADKTDAAWHEDVTITFTLKDGYSVGADFAVKVNGQKIELDQDGKYTIQDMEAAVVVTVEGVADTTAPTVTVTLEDNWNSLWNGITFGKFFKETKTFTISAEDKETGLKTVSYYLASEELEDVTTAAVTWTAYDLTGSGVSVDPDKVFVIYAKAEDNAGNITYVNSNGIVLDKTDPVITGVTNGAVYYTTQKITANDTYLDTKKLNGTEFDGTIPGDPAQETKHTIVATDKAGNNTTFEITMKPISPLAADLPTEETVKLVDKGAIEAIKQNVSNVSTTHATDAEKAKLKDIIDRCDLLLNRIERAENVIALINAMPDVSKVEPDDKTAIDAYDAAAAAYNDANLPASSKRMVGEENKAKLDAMLKALTAYDVIKGHKSSYTRGSGKTFSLTANGYFGKFTGLKIDGRILDSKYYTAKSGSTIVTLKNSYLDSLSDGKHTVEFLYTDGSTGGDHYFRISTNNGSPFTGDNNHITMFRGIMMTSLLCMAMMIMFIPRKKGKYQR